MSESSETSWERPIPRRDNISRPFWNAGAEGRLLIQKCPDCGHRQFYPRAVCTECGGTPEWEEVSGHGSVHTFTVIHQNYAKPFRDELPYVVAMIELEEDPTVRMMSNVVGCDPADVHIGMAVEVEFREAEEKTGVAFWHPAP